MQVAVFPLAVPYLLNPAGSSCWSRYRPRRARWLCSRSSSGCLRWCSRLTSTVFRWAVQVSSKMDASRMLVTEKVFGFLLAALGVQLALNGLADVGVIHLTIGH